jgi:hypothetical protein
MAEKAPSKNAGTKPRERLLKARPTASPKSEPVCPSPSTTNEESGSGATAMYEPPRFQFFLIDSGWDGAAASVIRQNLRMVTQLQNHDPFYVLTRSQSSELLKRHPHLIGKDPILIARDIQGCHSSGEVQYHGFHLNLGTIKDPESALEVLQNFINFLAVHRKSADIDRLIKQQLHRDGLVGAVEVLRGSSEALI